MKLVIDIPENLYNFVNTKRPNGYYNNFDEFDCYDISKCIRNGIPLPKGHGRLIDADAYKEKVFRKFPCNDRDDQNIRRLTEMAILNAPTIIEADKGE